MKRKWFYPLQDVVNERINQLYPDYDTASPEQKKKPCRVARQNMWQIVQKDMVVECDRIMVTVPENERNGDQSAYTHIDILSVMIKAHNGLLMYEMKFIASN